MASGNGLVAFPLYWPAELRAMAERYQKRRNLTSLNRAVIELLETHPAIAEIIEGVYATASQSERKSGP